MALTRINNQALINAEGTVLQLQTTRLNTSIASSTTNGTWVDIGTVSITPKSSSSKIYVSWNIHVYAQYENPQNWVAACVRVLRDTTEIYSDLANGYSYGHNLEGATSRTMGWISNDYHDSPSSTSSITYKIQGTRSHSDDGLIYFNNPSYAGGGRITVMEIAG